MPADIKTLSIRIDNNGGGTIWYDDVVIRRNTAPASEIVEESNYYPFGMKQEGYNNIVQTTRNLPAQRYKYNSKEYQDELSLNWYDYGARNYDAALGRWMNIDPLAENSRRWSPYTFVYNNSLRFVDPDGRQGEDYITINTKTKTAHVTETDDEYDTVTIDGVVSSTKSGLYTATSLRTQGYDVTEAYAVGSSLSDWASATFGLGKILSGVYNFFNSNSSVSNTTSTNRSETLANNKQRGKEFEQKATQDLKNEGHQNVQEQVTIQPNGAKGKVRLDQVSQKDGKINLTDSKASATAPLTRNQKSGYPAIERNGGTIVGKGKPGYPGGTQISPTKVDIRRPN